MCEYCGCQDVPAIAELTAEHEAIVNLMGEVRAALDHVRAEDVAYGCQRILAVLRPHVQVEEQALFPPMRAEFPEQIDGLLAEHDQIERVLAEAGTAAAAGPGWPQRLLAALHDLREHILKEQDGVFPASLAILTPEHWEVIDRIRSAET